MSALPVVDRFWSKVAKADGDGCWVWLGSRFATGLRYGQFWVRRGKVVKAHRFAYELTHGPLPPEIQVRHRCDNPICVRPSHLLAGRHTDNMRDRAERRRTACGEKIATGKLTATKVLDILSALRRGERRRVLADQYGVTRGAIASIATGRSWRHLHEEQRSA